MLLHLLAQAAPDVLPAWWSTLLQAGSFGLICYVVVVSYPKHGREAREERETRDKLFKGIVDELTARCDARTAVLVEAIKEQTNVSAVLARDAAAVIAVATKEAAVASLAMAKEMSVRVEKALVRYAQPQSLRGKEPMS